MAAFQPTLAVSPELGLVGRLSVLFCDLRNIGFLQGLASSIVRWGQASGRGVCVCVEFDFGVKVVLNLSG